MVALVALAIILYYVAEENELDSRILTYPLDIPALLMGVLRTVYPLGGKGERVRWSMFVILASACFLADWRIPGPVFMGAFAWLALLMIYLDSYGYLWRSWQFFARLYRHRDS